MLLFMYGLQTPGEQDAIFGGFFFILQSAVTWINASNLSFY